MDGSNDLCDTTWELVEMRLQVPSVWRLDLQLVTFNLGLQATRHGEGFSKECCYNFKFNVLEMSLGEKSSRFTPFNVSMAVKCYPVLRDDFIVKDIVDIYFLPKEPSAL